MVYLSRLKIILIGLALISVVFGASNVSAADPHILFRVDTAETQAALDGHQLFHSTRIGPGE